MRNFSNDSQYKFLYASYGNFSLEIKTKSEAVGREVIKLFDRRSGRVWFLLVNDDGGLMNEIFNFIGSPDAENTILYRNFIFNRILSAKYIILKRNSSVGNIQNFIGRAYKKRKYIKQFKK